MAKIFQCPFCSKKSTRGAGLASHIRSAHPKQRTSRTEQTATSATPKAPPSATASGAASPGASRVTPLIAKKTAALTATESAKGTSSAGDLLQKAFAQLNERKRAIEEELSHSEDLRKELETVNLQVESLKTALGAFESDAAPRSSDEAVESGEVQEKAPEKTSTFAEFAGNKRALVRSIVESRAAAGITPKEIEGIFTQRKISKGRNLIYNVLSLSVQRGKMRREGGKYFPVTGSASPLKKPSRHQAA